MLFLGIETSCDETAAAVVTEAGEVRASVIASSAALHTATGGIVPEVASREQVGAIAPVVLQALAEAGVQPSELTAIGVTVGPGLIGSLLTGVAAANTLATFADKPLVGVNHIFGHLRSVYLERAASDFAYPVVTLTASGGHTELHLTRTAESAPELLGSTRDDAAGEAFDKVARLLGLGYPGGPAIGRVAATATEQVEPLPRSWLLPRDISGNFDSVTLGQRLRNGRNTLDNFDFSFSGLKSEVRRRTLAMPLSPAAQAALAAEFQRAVCDVLATKALLAARQHGACEVHLTGGVSANADLRQQLEEYLSPEGIALRTPARAEYCTDNAAMIALAASWLYRREPARYAASRCLDADLRPPLV
jgi:N6-L-threonylcarbamoyladenine synthase